MKKVICCPEEHLPKRLDPEALYFSMFSSARRAKIGHVALDLPTAIRRDLLAPSVQAWDFTIIASAVAAADKGILRSNSADGWTRMIDLTVSLVDPAVWDTRRAELEHMLRFLTGDFWSLRFRSGGAKPPRPTKVRMREADCVCLLSGGIDSLVGAIDLTADGKKPLFVSQVMRGDKDAQTEFAAALGSGADRHCQWSFAVGHPGASELSTRARSIVFFAFAALAVAGLASSKKRPVEIVVPENGFISLNVPLGPGRLGSLSTKTTHPVFMDAVQELWNAVGIHARLVFPYRNKTKGELLRNCADRQKLLSLIGHSKSCGKSGRINQHCGKCIPCLVRRAAFLEAKLPDTTAKGYYHEISHSKSKDVAAAAAAYIRYQDEGIRRFTCGQLAFAPSSVRGQYESVVARGMDELGQLLSLHSVI